MPAKPLNQILGYYPSSNGGGGALNGTSINPKQFSGSTTQGHSHGILNSPSTTMSKSSVTIVEEPASNFGCKTKLFGVPLHSKKRLHPEYGSINVNNSLETNKARLVLDKDDLGLNLMPPSAC